VFPHAINPSAGKLATIVGTGDREQAKCDGKDSHAHAPTSFSSPVATVHDVTMTKGRNEAVYGKGTCWVGVEYKDSRACD
jgi:hypothetical protein